MSILAVILAAAAVYVGVLTSGGPAWVAMPAAVIVAALGLILDGVSRLRR